MKPHAFVPGKVATDRCISRFAFVDNDSVRCGLPKIHEIHEEPVPVKPRRIQLVVWHRGTHQAAYYEVAQEDGWKIDCDSRHIVIGKGLPRKMIPLDNVLSFDIEELP